MRQFSVAQFLIVCLIGEGAMAAVPAGSWIFDSSPDYPGFTRLIVDGTAATPGGKITSRWYGDLPLKDVRVDGDKVVFRIYNGNPRVTQSDIVLAPEGDKVRMVGKLWYQAFDITARKGTPTEIASLDFPTHPLPARRVVPQKNLAATPPMGWSSWNKFETNIDDKTIREIADALVATGLRDVGYVHVNIDDGWQGKRDAKGVLQSNRNFPDMKALADYVHARGLKLGLYTSPGPKSCAGYEGSYGHVRTDAQTFAHWGIDYLKYDLCSGEAFYHTAETVYATYQEMGEALNATGRDIVFSLCQYGRFDVGAWGRDVGGHLWRTTGDIEDKYDVMARIGFEKNGVPNHTGPNGWNDPDMLEVGNGGMSLDEYKTHFSLWALMAAPLVLGNDVRNMTAETMRLLSNKDVIAVDQDKLGAQGLPVKKAGTTEIWTKRLADGAVAVGLFNRADKASTIGATWAEIGVNGKTWRDLWTGKVATAEAAFTFSVPAHGVVLLRVK